jgi:predicted DNA-binding transcriptional regulator AlpA
LPEIQNPFTLRGNAERRYQMKPAESEILQFLRTSPGFSASISIEPFINAKQASEMLHLSAKTLLRFARQGIIPAHPLTGTTRRQWRFLESELYAWAHERVNLLASDPCLNSRRK